MKTTAQKTVYFPTAIFEQWMEQSGTTRDQLAESDDSACLLPFLDGETKITPELCDVLHKLTGVESDFWNHADVRFHEAVKAQIVETVKNRLLTLSLSLDALQERLEIYPGIIERFVEGREDEDGQKIQDLEADLELVPGTLSDLLYL